MKKLTVILSIMLTMLYKFVPALMGGQESFKDQWVLELRSDPREAHLTFRYQSPVPGGNNRQGRTTRDSDTGFNIPVEQLQGLTREQITSGSASVAFRVVRDAGVIICEGRLEGAKGSGSFTFTPAPRFLTELNRRGYDVSTLTSEQQFHMTLHDVSFALIDELQAQGAERPSLDHLVTMGEHGINAEYLRELQICGYKIQTVEMLIRMRDHGVSANYIRELRRFGYDAQSIESLIEMRDHGVSVRFVAELDQLGYKQVPVEMLIRLCDHGIGAKSVQQLKERYSNLTLEQVIQINKHGMK
jgi:hypothetical protein